MDIGHRSGSATDTARAPYSSAVRSQQARTTRRAIVAAAGELFVEQGYAATTIDAVAARAGVGRKTVFTSVGGKGELLKLAWDMALAGDDEPVPMSERPAVQAMIAERDPSRLVRMWVDMLVDVGARAAPIGAVILAASDVDPASRELLELIRRESLEGATAFVTHLAGLGGLRTDLSIERGADACWALVNSLLLDLVVNTRGWTQQEYAEWLARLAAATLLDSPAPASSRRAERIRTVRRPKRDRYDALVGGQVVGHLAYQRSKRLVVLIRTEVDAGAEDRGVAQALARRALDDVRADGTRRVISVCPYVTWWIGRHPDYASLVYAAPAR